MQIVDAQTLQSYFSEIDLQSASSGEYTLVFADIDNDQDETTEGYALKYDSQDTDALSWSPSSNLMKISGSLNLADDSVAVRFGADQDVTLSHVADTGLQLNSGMELQFRNSDSKIHSSTSSQLDLTGTSVIKSTAPQVELEASTEVLLDSPKVHLEDDSASLVFGADEDVTLTHDGGEGLDVTAAGAFDISAGAASQIDTSAGALTLDGAAGINLQGNASEIDVTTTGNFDLNAAAIELSGSSYGSWSADGNISLDANGGGSISIQAESNIDMDGTSVAIDATSGQVTMDASAEVVIGGVSATTVDIGKPGIETDILGTLSVDQAAVFDSSVTITGDLTVNGTNTVVNSTTMTVDDTIIVLGQGAESTRSSFDLGIVFEQSGSGDTNKAFFYDTSEGHFRLMESLSEDGSENTIDASAGSYAKLQLGEIDVDGAADIQGAANLQSTLAVADTSSLNGDVNLGSDSSDTLVVNALVDSDIKPEDDSTHSLGGSGEEWLKLWVNDIESENGSLDLTADLVTVSGHFDVAGVTASFGALASYSNEDVDVGNDAIMVRDDSDDTAKHMSFVELGQYLSRGTEADAPGTGIQVDTNGVLSIDVVEQYAVRDDSDSTAGLAFTISHNYSSAILPDSFELFLNGQLQIMDGKKTGYSDYSVSGFTVTMTEAIDANDVVVIRYLLK